MSKTNCVNCGASKEISDMQCPFCGTKYVDLATIDLMGDEPIFIQMKGKSGIITAKAYITDRTLNFHNEYLECRSVSGYSRNIHVGTNVTGEIRFTLYERI